MKRNEQQKKYHAEKERGYRARRSAERDKAIGMFAGSAAVLMEKHGYSLGQLIDLITQEKE